MLFVVVYIMCCVCCLHRVLCLLFTSCVVFVVYIVCCVCCLHRVLCLFTSCVVFVVYIVCCVCLHCVLCCCSTELGTRWTDHSPLLCGRSPWAARLSVRSPWATRLSVLSHQPNIILLETQSYIQLYITINNFILHYNSFLYHHNYVIT